MNNKRKIYFLYTVFLLVLLFVADLVVGLFYNTIASSHAAYGKLNIEIFLEQIDVQKALNEKPHPYMLWVNTPEFFNKNGVKQTNNLGYRNQDNFELAADKDKIRILTLGGSTTWGYLLNDPEDTWSRQLEGILNNKMTGELAGAENRIQVINGGLNYGTSAEMLSHYIFRDRYLQPDIVIIHTGGNDAVPLIYDDYDPEYSHFRPGWGAQTYRLRKGERFLIEHSNILKMFYAFWMRDGVALPYVNKQAKSFDLPDEYYIQNATGNEPIGFKRNLELLIRNIIADGATPILFPFITTTDSMHNRLQPESRKRAAYINRIRKGAKIAIKKHRTIMKNLSAKYRIPLLELPAENIPIKYFLDHCHLSQEGEKIKAMFLADNIDSLRTGKNFRKTFHRF